MKLYKPSYTLQLIPLLLSFLLTELILGYDTTTANEIQLHDTYLIIDGWQILTILFLIIGFIMNLIIVIINKLKRIDCNTIFLGYNSIILIIIGYIFYAITNSIFINTLFDKPDYVEQELVGSNLNEFIIKAGTMLGIFLLTEMIVIIKTIQIKRNMSTNKRL